MEYSRKSLTISTRFVHKLAPHFCLLEIINTNNDLNSIKKYILPAVYLYFYQLYFCN